MRIAVIAASGRSGQAFVREALASGHQIHAGIRGQNPFDQTQNLKVFQCDATNISQVTALIERCDAVVSLIGHIKGSDPFVQTAATKTLVRAAEAAGVRRAVSLTGVGVGTRHRWLKKPLAIVAELMGRILKIDRLRDGIAHAQVLEKSDLDWTVLKVMLLSDGQPGKFRLKAKGLVKVPTPRREVARAILQLLERGTFIREYPVVAKR
jgi:nucleoside-diphosphate-sugar epimerase